MKRKLGGLLLAFGMALGLMAFRKQAAPPDLSSPKAAVRSFIAAVKDGDIPTMQKCVQGETDTNLLKELLGSGAEFPKFTISSIIAESDQTTAHVAVEYTFASVTKEDADWKDVRMADMFTLIKQGETWRLIADPAVKDLSGDPQLSVFSLLFQTRPLSFVVAVSGSPQVAKSFATAQTKARATACLSNAKQISTGVLIYSQDYDEVTPRKGASYTELVDPYIKNQRVFTCPLAPAGTISYTFNSGVAGVPMSVITAPAKTVMIYEGKDGKLDYKHEGQAVVGFMDGHCKLIKPEEAAGLIWTVKAPKAPVKPGKKQGRK